MCHKTHLQQLGNRKACPVPASVETTAASIGKFSEDVEGLEQKDVCQGIGMAGRGGGSVLGGE